MRSWPILLLLALGCGNGSGVQDAGELSDAAPTPPTENWERDLLRTDLTFDIEAGTGEATILFAQGAAGASLEVGDLELLTVQLGDAPLAFLLTGSRLDLALPPSADQAIIITYRFVGHDGFAGYRSAGSTLTWPTWCGNLFPCKSDPAEGARYSVTANGVPRGETAITTPDLPGEAPAYVVAFAHGIYEYLDLGMTPAGTEVGAYVRPGGMERAIGGTEFLLDYVDFFESRLGPYSFGPAIAAVSVQWGLGAFGGIEHHPYFHVSSGAMGSHEVMAHEVAHGWFGNGVRIACWEDLVLSEGVAQYLTLRAIEDAEGLAAANELWATIDARLRSAVASGDTPAYPEGCQEIDILNTPLVSRIPYEKGAFFLRAVEEELGRGTLDEALSSFYTEHVGRAAHMSDLIGQIEATSNQSIIALENAWLRELGIPEVP